MPNWSYNILNASDEVLKQIVNEEGEIDFNTVIPMPKELKGTVSPNRDDTQEKKDASKNLIEKYGSNNWYDWSCENWGTKWNGVSDEPYSYVIGSGDTLFTYGEGIIHFRTAWSYPEGFIEALSKKFPNELIEFEGVCQIGEKKWRLEDIASQNVLRMVADMSLIYQNLKKVNGILT